MNQEKYIGMDVHAATISALTFHRAVKAVPVLDQFCVLVVTDPHNVLFRLRVASKYDGFDVPLDLALKAIIGPERCAS